MEITRAVSSGNCQPRHNPLIIKLSGILDETKFQLIRGGEEADLTITDGLFTASAIPEPTTAVLFLVEAFGVLRRR